jgi:MIP family channel proteins
VNQTLVRPAAAEFIGTMLFVFIGAGSVVVTASGQGPTALVVALAHGAAIAMAVSATMSISGGHLNPAVTIGMLAIRKIDGRTALAYTGAQLAGGVAAAALIKWLFPVNAARVVNLGAPALATQVTLLQGTLLEAVLTFVLMSAMLGTLVASRAPKIGGLGVGLAVLAAALCAGPLTGAALNPARAFGPALVAFEFHAQEAS